MSVVAWDRDDIRMLPRFIDALVVASAERSDQLAEVAKAHGPMIVVIPRGSDVAARNMPGAAIATDGEVAARLRRLYESLLHIEVQPDGGPGE
jgi:hypothetical protein